MLLKMAVEETEIDSVALEPAWIKQKGYLEALLACLQRKHSDTLRGAKRPPLFYLETGSRMNTAGFCEEP